MANPTFTFDRSTQRYRYTSGDRKGQFISRNRMLELLDAKVEQIKGDIDQITELLLGDKISLGAWEETIALAIKQGTIQGYTLGRGGVDRLTQADYGRIGNHLRGQYTYLRRFSEEIAQGRLSKAQIRRRARQYSAAFVGIYEYGRKESHRVDGFQWERRRLRVAEHCPDCIGYQNQGWQPIGSLPPIGSASQCLTNCKCYFQYSKEVLKPTDKLNQGLSLGLKQSFGWIA